ncbi:MAG: acetyl-CoA synthetase [Actinomycetes bacterium]
MTHPRAACIVGVAQRTVRPVEAPAPEPLELWADVGHAAAQDAGTPHTLASIDALHVVFTQSWAYDDPAARLSERLGISPRLQRYSGVGGTTPQQLVSSAADAMAAGTLDSALIVGAEALATRRQLRRSGERPSWSHPHPAGFRYPPHGVPHPSQQRHGATMPTFTFPLVDSARRAHLGSSLSTYVSGIGRMLAPMTEVAAKNPYAWFPETATPDELVTATPDNRLIASPYAKRTIAVMDVDMAAAVLVMTHEAADRHGVPQDRRVYLRGSAFADDPETIAERPQLHRSPAMTAASGAALAAAAVTVDDIAYFDLYSCFASALHLGCDALAIDPTDARGLTVTGGLPYAGGPGSNYVLHSLASMAGVLREDPGAFGVVSGLSMHLAGHSYAVYSTEPGPTVLRPISFGAPRSQPIADSFTGAATVAAYTVVYDREGDPTAGIVICDVGDGCRAYARVEDLDLLADAEQRELVGQPVIMTTDGTVNRVRW